MTTNMREVKAISSPVSGHGALGRACDAPAGPARIDDINQPPAVRYAALMAFIERQKRRERNRRATQRAWRKGDLLGEHPRGRLFISSGSHSFAVIDGLVHDWNRKPRPSRQVREAWRKP